MSAPASDAAPAGGARLIDGKAVADAIREELRLRVAALAAAAGRAPGLAVLLVGARADSATYVRMKKKACAEAGIADFGRDLPADAGEAAIVAAVAELNADPRVDGILVQLPLPAGVSEERVLDAISFEKDADGLHPLNAGYLALKGRAPLSTACTPKGCLELLRRSGVALAGKRAVVLGRSNIVGVPVAALLQRENCTVTVCHSRTPDIAAHVREADIVVAAIGQPGFLRGEWLKPGAVVIDVGINQVPDASKKAGVRLVGDADFESCAAPGRAGAITPVPGGVGPMTIAMLLSNTVDLFERRVAAAAAAAAAAGDAGAASASPAAPPAAPAPASKRTLFDKIVAGEIPCAKVYEDALCLAFRDIQPCAPAHILLVPKVRGRLDQLQHATPADAPLLGHLMATVGVVARQEGLTAGFRVVVNDGDLGCQSVDHLHLHIIGGTQLAWPPTGLAFGAKH